MAHFIWQQCAAPDCGATGEIKSPATQAADLRAAGWAFERHPYDTTDWWYCTSHKTPRSTRNGI